MTFYLYILLLYITNICADVTVFDRDDSAKAIYRSLDFPALFGPDLPHEGTEGYVVAIQPDDGCGNITKPEPYHASAVWIALIARSPDKCKYVHKVYNAQKAGYKAVIVHNVGSDLIWQMAGDGGLEQNAINISAVFISESAGSRLREYAYHSGWSRQHKVRVDGRLPSLDWGEYFLPFVVTLCVCLMIILAFFIVRCIRDRQRRNRHRLSRRNLRKIPTKPYHEGDPYDCCAICLDDYVENEKLRVLPCDHAFHQKCIDPWLTKNRRVCPMCKRRILLPGEWDPGSDAENSTYDSDDEEAAERRPLLANAANAAEVSHRSVPVSPSSDRSETSTQTSLRTTGTALSAAMARAQCPHGCVQNDECSHARRSTAGSANLAYSSSDDDYLPPQARANPTIVHILTENEEPEPESTTASTSTLGSANGDEEAPAPKKARSAKRPKEAKKKTKKSSKRSSKSPPNGSSDEPPAGSSGRGGNVIV